MTPEICYDILRNISDTDCMIMGLDPKKSRPENMIHKIFPVSPVAIRPSAKVDFLESSTKEDDLTHKLADIVKANVRIENSRSLRMILHQNMVWIINIYCNSIFTQILIMNLRLFLNQSKETNQRLNL